MQATHGSDVLIVGAGPGGLTLANDLAGRGVQFRVIDALPEPIRDSRANGVLGRTLMSLDKLGLAEPMLAAAKKPTPVMREYFGAKLVAETDFAAVDRDGYPLMLPIFEQRLVRVLETALARRGHRVEWSTRLVSFTQESDGITAEIDRDGVHDTVRAGWIVGGDGGHSTVRKALTPDFPGGASGLQGLTCECDLDWQRSRDIWWTWQSSEGVVVAIYNDFSEKWNLKVMEPGQEGLEGSDDARAEHAITLLRRASGDPDVKLTNARWNRDGLFSQRIAERFITGRAILIGDAAHVFSSALSHGVHCAIEDALNLGWKLDLTISGAAAPSLLQSYETERHGHANDVVRKTRWVQRFFGLRGAVRKALWTALFTVGKRLRSIGAIGNKQAERLITSYRESPLSRNDSSQATPQTQAGRHVPDAACRVGGAPVRLLEVIRGPASDLLLFAGASPSAETITALRAIERGVRLLGKCLRLHFVFSSQAHASAAGFLENDTRVIVDGLARLELEFGIREPEVVFLRPDGYIGLRARDLLPQTVLGYLKGIYSMTPAAAALYDEEITEVRHYPPPVERDTGKAVTVRMFSGLR
jgi:2-polyprenyl-6-methoxyphenol hydroxylase-like FAD-dependent oxidoreductase